MAFTERLAFLISAKADDAIREFKKVGASADNDLSRAEKGINRLSGAANKMSAVAALPVAAAMSVAAAAASDLEQSVGAVESTFGNAGDAIEEFGETAAETAGLSKREVNEMAAALGASLQGMGFEATEAAETVVDLEKRAADMAATFGGSTTEAVEAMGSLLRGERDPIERYGVSIKEADVQARILAKGLDTSTTAAQKKATAVASLELLMEQTAKTEGQFARESEGAAGSLARARAQMENATAELGTHLLPIVAKAAGGVAELASMFGSLPEPVQTGVLALAGVAVASGPILTVAGNVLTLHKRIKDLSASAVVGKGIFGGLATAIVGLGIQSAATGDLIKSDLSDEISDAIANLAAKTDDELGQMTIKSRQTLGLFALAVEENIVVAQRWRDALAASGEDTSELDKILTDNVKRYREVRDSTTEAAVKVEDLGEATETAAVSFERITGQARDTREEIEELTEQMHEQLEVTNELIDAGLGYEGALNRTEDALKDYWEAGQKAKEGGGDQAAVTEAIERATLDAAEAILNQSRAAVEYAEDLKTLNGETLSAADAARIQREDLQKVANTLSPSEPLRQRLDGYIGQLAETEGTRIAKLQAEVEDAKTKLREVDNIFKGMEERTARLYVEPFVRPVRQAPLPEDQAFGPGAIVVNINGANQDLGSIAEEVSRSIAWGLGGLGGI